MHSILSGLVIHNLEDACKLSEKACHRAQAEFILCVTIFFFFGTQMTHLAAFPTRHF